MLEQFWNQMVNRVGESVPRLLWALAILIIGWVVSRMVAAVVRAALRRTTIDNRLADWIRGEDKEKKVEVELWISRLVFYLGMVFVLVAFFQALGLTIITEPLNRMLNGLFEFGPRILAAVLLVALAWIVATSLRFIVTRSLLASKFEEKVGTEAGLEQVKPIPLSKTLGESVYWLVYLLFLPAVLNALKLDGLMQPVQGMIDKLLSYLPNILGALVILALGWFASRVVKRIVTSLFAAVGADRLSERAGVDKVLGEKKLSWLLGFIVYVLILVPVIVAALNALKLDAITQPASEMLNRILGALPHILGAVLVLGLAYLVGKVVAAMVTNLLSGIGFNRILVAIGLAKEEVPEGKKKPSEIVGYLVMVAVILFASMEAANLLGFTSLREQMARFVEFGGNVVLGLVIFGMGLFFANLAAGAIQASRSEQARMMASAARIAIVILTGAMALRRMGLADDIINLAFGITLGAVGVAFAIAFGMGGREIAAGKLRGWVEGKGSQ